MRRASAHTRTYAGHLNGQTQDCLFPLSLFVFKIVAIDSYSHSPKCSHCPCMRASIEMPLNLKWPKCGAVYFNFDFFLQFLTRKWLHMRACSQCSHTHTNTRFIKYSSSPIRLQFCFSLFSRSFSLQSNRFCNWLSNCLLYGIPIYYFCIDNRNNRNYMPKWETRQNKKKTNERARVLRWKPSITWKIKLRLD